MAAIISKMPCVNGNCGGYYGKPKCLCYHSDPKKNKKENDVTENVVENRYERRTRVKSQKAKLAEEQALENDKQMACKPSSREKAIETVTKAICESPEPFKATLTRVGVSEIPNVE